MDIEFWSHNNHPHFGEIATRPSALLCGAC